MEVKSYYLSNFRSITIGIIFIIMGIATTFIGFDIKRSFWNNFQSMIIDFRGIMHFIVSILLLLFRAGLIFFGYITIKYRSKIIRAKTDDKGLYFKEITGGNKLERLSFDLNPFTLLHYSKITNIYYVEDFWKGNYLEIETSSGRKILTALNVLSKSDKNEIYNTVKKQINKKNC